MSGPADRRFMAQALALGDDARGRSAPNPNVGCVIVSNGEIVGRGATAEGGRPHAEAIALDQAGKRATGSTVYVTLERLEAKGLVRSRIGDPTPERGGRRRKHFAILPKGRRALGQAYRHFKVMAEGFERQFERS